jgi:hypothetical protein
MPTHVRVSSIVSLFHLSEPYPRVQRAEASLLAIRGHVGRGLTDELVVPVEGVPACHRTLEKLRNAAVFILTFAHMRGKKVHGFLHGVQRHFITLRVLTSDLGWYENVDRDLDEVLFSCRELEVGQIIRFFVDELAIRVA